MTAETSLPFDATGFRDSVPLIIQGAVGISPKMIAGALTATEAVWPLGFSMSGTSQFRELSWPENPKQVEEIRVYLQPGTIQFWWEEAPHMAEKEVVREEPRTRKRELRWLERNRNKLAEQYAGQWIVLEKQKIISHSNSSAAVLKQAREKGIRVPFLLRIPSRDEGPLALKANYV